MTATSVDEVARETEERMKKALEALGHELASIRTGRASASLIDRLVVESYGQHLPLKQLAGVATPDARTLSITAWDRASIPAIRKAIETSDLHLTPQIDGNTIRLLIPPLNEERRRDLVKLLRKKGEEAKVGLRSLRHKAVDELRLLQKAHTITEDEQKRAGDRIQKLTDRFGKEIETLLDHKEREIMEV